MKTHTALSYSSPVGVIESVPSGGVLRLLRWGAPTDVAEAGADVAADVVAETWRQLDEYFAGRRRTFDIPCEPEGTDFQCAVWRAVAEVPYGATATYADIARAVGRPTAVRAVARAIGANPLIIIIPCHRIIGSDGSLTGYAGGLDKKRALLELEAANSGIFGCVSDD